MNSDEIRFRYKKTGEIFSAPRRFFYKDGTLHFTPPDEMGGKYIPRTYINKDEYEIIPQEDFFEFRRQTARQVLCTLLKHRDYVWNDDEVINKAISLTDKLIDKL